jgi:uncharacterized protein
VLKKAAAMGNAEAQYNLGYCYQSGTGIETNSKAAVE